MRRGQDRTSGPVASRAAAPVVSRPTPALPAEPVKPAFSPFEADRNRRRFEGVPEGHQVSTTAGTSVAQNTAQSVVAVPPPVPVGEPVRVPPPVTVAPVELQAAPVPEPTPVPEVAPVIRIAAEAAANDDAVERLQAAVVKALSSAKSQSSATDAMVDARFSLSGEELTIQTGLSKTMLPVVLNGDADKLIRGAIGQASAARLKVVVLPAEPDMAKVVKKVRAPRVGSAQAKAMEHPIVQRAQSLFHADIRNVIDLREDD